MPRYIDADALIDNIPQADLSNDKKISKCGAIADMVLLVCDAPTIDVAPVVHGEWILVGTNEHDYETSVEEKCSLCGRYVYRYDTEPQDNFCPNCGAKMDGEGEESK